MKAFSFSIVEVPPTTTTTTPAVPPTCPPDTFQCSSGECIDINLVCNFVPNCPGNEDEADCPVHFDFDSCGDLLG